MFEKYVALYSTGEIHSSHKNTHQFDEKDLVAIITHKHDGTREIWWNDNFTPKTEFEQSVVLHAEAMTEFKHDGGITPEIQHMRKAHL